VFGTPGDQTLIWLHCKNLTFFPKLNSIVLLEYVWIEKCFELKEFFKINLKKFLNDENLSSILFKLNLRNFK
jgi:hypothetical protein